MRVKVSAAGGNHVVEQPKWRLADTRGHAVRRSSGGELMKRFLLVMAICVLVVGVAEAQATRTWVSGVGDDVNPCSRTAPCKTFAGAISKTAAGGEISVLDPGGYGAVTMTKSIYINGTHGAGYGSILNVLVNGVTINITDP